MITIEKFGLVEFIPWPSLRICLIDHEYTIVRLLMLQKIMDMVEETTQMFRTIPSIIFWHDWCSNADAGILTWMGQW
jgi:hypothetical protein